MLTSELFLRVHKYLSGELRLEELEEWVVPRLPIFYALPFSTTTQLVDEIESGLAEMDEGINSESEFQKSLGKFLSEWAMPLLYPDTETITQSGFSDKLYTENFSHSGFTMSWAVQ